MIDVLLLVFGMLIGASAVVIVDLWVERWIVKRIREQLELQAGLKAVAQQRVFGTSSGVMNDIFRNFVGISTSNNENHK